MDTSAPAVSVVIPAHNAESTLAEALRSVAAQVPPPAEVIVVDDGSTDGTAAVAAATPGVRLIRQRNAGPSAARNAGVAEAGGDWIAFADADDEWLPGKLALQMACTQRLPEAALIAADWVRRRAELAAPVGRARITTFGYRDVLVLNRFQTSTVLVRASVLRRAGGFDARFDGAEDWETWLRCSKLGLVVKLDVPLVVYRDESAGYSKNLRRLYAAMVVMLDREAGEGRLSPGSLRMIRAWHHERFAIAFWRDGDTPAALAALRDLRTAGVTSAAPVAGVRYLVPFLTGRVRRRARRIVAR